MVKLSLPKVSLNKGLKHISLIAITSLLIYGCGSTPKSTPRAVQTTIIEVGQTSLSANEYLSKANTLRGLNRQAMELNAFRAALSQSPTPDVALIEMIYRRLATQSMLSDSHTMEWQQNQAVRLTQRGKFTEALEVLKPQTSWQVTPSRWYEYYQQQVTLQTTLGQIPQAVTTLGNSFKYAQNVEQNNELSDAMWMLLSQLTIEQLNEVPTDSQPLAGWKELAQITQDSLSSPRTLQQRVLQWTVDNSNHIGAQRLPKNLELMLSVEAFSPNKIALLLPLSGKYARLGQAVQHGVVSNLIAHNTQQELITFDTVALGATEAMAKAIEQGAEFVIGPLLKHHVSQVSAMASDIPTLFLNHNDSPLLQQQFSFSLTREAEAEQGLEYIYQQGKRKPVIVAPDNVQGHKIARVFNDKWLELNQDDPEVKPIEAFYFDSDAKLKQTIEMLFETDQSQARINHMRLLVGKKMKSETRSRRDIDAIYLVANPKQTGMLMPSVEVTVSAFAPQVAVYVGSSGNNQLDTTRSLSHLNNLTLSDMPWFIQHPAPLSPNYVKKLWPDIKQSQMRLFAMGYDAYALIGRLAQMTLFPHFSLDGFSGTLSLDEERDIIRKMAWAQYQRGRLTKQQ